MPVDLPKGVEAKQAEGRLQVNGPRGNLEMTIPPHMVIQIEDGVLRVERPSDSREHRALHGLTRALAANMVEGVSDGFKKTLQIIGVGYRAEKNAKGIRLHLGYSHVIDYPAPDGVSIDVPQPTTVVVEGSDKQKVGQAAAEIRGFRPPEPYKGKGIRYENEQVRRKAGKTAGA
jgi:large subunit ribosomal protein L6